MGKIMRKFDYDYDRVYYACYKMAKRDYKGMDEEWYKEKAKADVPNLMLEIFKCNLIDRIKKIGFKKDYAIDCANKITDIIPKELYGNIQEWIDDKPISDIKYKGISIKDIMEQDIKYGVKHDFFESLEAMMMYIQCGCRDKSICKKYFRYY